MGVGGHFWDLLKPHARFEGFDFLRNKRVAVDLSYWIVQHETAIKGYTRNPHIRITFFRTVNLFSKVQLLLFLARGRGYYALLHAYFDGFLSALLFFSFNFVFLFVLVTVFLWGYVGFKSLIHVGFSVIGGILFLVWTSITYGDFTGYVSSYFVVCEFGIFLFWAMHMIVYLLFNVYLDMILDCVLQY